MHICTLSTSPYMLHIENWYLFIYLLLYLCLSLHLCFHSHFCLYKSILQQKTITCERYLCVACGMSLTDRAMIHFITGSLNSLFNNYTPIWRYIYNVTARVLSYQSLKAHVFYSQKFNLSFTNIFYILVLILFEYLKSGIHHFVDCFDWEHLSVRFRHPVSFV